MKILLDSCTFLWIMADAPELSARARGLFSDPLHEVYLSAVSAWEIGVKHALGRLPLPEAPGRCIPAQRRSHGVLSLDLDEPSVLNLAGLPALHKDPFDRMLICQALEHGLTILTPDTEIRQYPMARTDW